MFIKKIIFLLSILSISAVSAGGADHDSHGANEGGHESFTVFLEDAVAKVQGVQIAQAVARKLQQTSISYGQLVLGSQQVSHVRSRFEGLVGEVAVDVGDKVKAGDLLAKIESNQSLQYYDLRSPINGVVLERHANRGEFTAEQLLFTLADFSTLWAELKIYPVQMQDVKAGQSVSFMLNGKNVKAKIEHIIPVLDQAYQLARVKVMNAEGLFLPGSLVQAEITLAEFSVKQAVKNGAVQSLEGKQGVFVKKGQQYQFKKLLLGRRDGNYTEVLEGLAEGEEYVSVGSYLLKADIEKSQAEHQH
jgi:cobalt-zinc-cadmium efflux system membrane fusion protein